MTIDRRNRLAFEEIADLYNQARPGYPDQMIQDVIELSGIDKSGNILEIGCGPGNATLAFARRGYHILAIELGQRLSDLAKKNCQLYPGVKIVNSSFEEWPLQENSFDLAISADAFHWIEPVIGYPKVAQALKDTGSAVFFWNIPVDPKTEWSKEIDKIYKETTPYIENPDKAFSEKWVVGIILENFSGSGRFGEVTIRQYSWSLHLDTESYLKLLRTYSGHRELDVHHRLSLYAGIRKVIDRYGGQVDKLQSTILFHASVKKGSLSGLF
jgi:SAM-dependent methyltransferase